MSISAHREGPARVARDEVPYPVAVSVVKEKNRSSGASRPPPPEDALGWTTPRKR